MRTVLKPSDLKAETAQILDRAIDAPQYVEQNGVLLVITKADQLAAFKDDLLDVPRRNRILKDLDDSEGW